MDASCSSSAAPILLSSSLVHAAIGMPPSDLNQDFDCFAVVHRPVAVGYPVEVRDPFEDAARLDLAFEDVRQQRVVCANRQDDARAVCLRGTHRFGLSSVGVTSRPEELAVDARRLQPFVTEDAGAAGVGERHDDEITDLDGADAGTDIRDDADGLVAHAATSVAGWHRLVRPEIATADGGGTHAGDGAGRPYQVGVGDGLDTDVAGAAQNSCAHRGFPPIRCSRFLSTPALPLKKIPACVTPSPAAFPLS